VKINERDALNIPKPQTERLDSTQGSNSDPAMVAKRSETRSDQIDLGRQTGLLTQAQTAGVDERALRIEQLRALVQSGQYQVDTAALSQAIVGAAINGY
jgi:anti-sigma28 factor (negative regulator of flagellin synthesis)